MKTTLYLGLEPPQPRPGQRLLHMPVIRIVPRAPADPAIIQFYGHLPLYTHGVFTSKPAVRIFFQYLPFFGFGLADLQRMKLAAVGKATAAELKKHGGSVTFVAAEETAEGVCQALAGEVHSGHYFCWPHSALSRPVIADFFKSKGCRYRDCAFYDTHYVQPDAAPPLDSIDQIVFTSPSTIEGFLRVYGKIPWNKELTPLGPVTEKQLFLLRE